MNWTRLHQVGRSSWSALGIIGVVVVLGLALGSIRGIVLPLIIAGILGTVLEPLVTGLERRGVGHTPATAVGLLATILVGALIIWLVVSGFIQQTPEIYRQLGAGWDSFLQWARTLDIDAVWLDRAREQLQGSMPGLGQGALGLVTSTFSSAVSFAIGTFFALFLLFFVIRDLSGFPAWVARVARLDGDVVEEMAEVVKHSLRGYFRGTAITAVLTAPIFVIPLLLLGVPLVIPIFVLYFFLSFVPFLGAWITGAFAVLIAFGSGGPSAALIVALTFTISNGTIQSAVSSWALGSALDLHPVAVLMATLIGGTVAGLIGMILGAPLLAAVVKSLAVARAHRADREAPPLLGPPGEAAVTP